MNFLNRHVGILMEYFRQSLPIPIDKFGEQDRKRSTWKILYPSFFDAPRSRWPKILPENRKWFSSVKWKKTSGIFMRYTGMITCNQILEPPSKHRAYTSHNLPFCKDWWNCGRICDSPAIPEWTGRNLTITPSSSMNWPIEITERILETTKPSVFSPVSWNAGADKSKTDRAWHPVWVFWRKHFRPGQGKSHSEFSKRWRSKGVPYIIEGRRRGFELNCCRLCIYVDPWWNPAVETGHWPYSPYQADQKHICTEWSVKTPLKIKILQLQEKKRALAKDIIARMTARLWKRWPGRMLSISSAN